jgi:hypothetical protein
MRNFLFGIVFILILLVGGLAYLGVVPGLSPMLARQVDLGIKPELAVVDKFDQSVRMQNELPGGVMPAAGKATYTGSKPLNVEVDSTQASSVFMYWKHLDAGTPLSNVQVRFNADGTAEASGILELGTAINLAKNLGYTDADIAKGEQYVSYVNGNLPFYIKGTGNVKNNVVTLNPTSFQLGRVTVPESITTPAARAVEDMAERRMKQLNGLDIKSATIENGKLKIDGTIPATIK